ncbi:MAG: two-component sensor histidine kinase, partial [Conexibacter sp.]|nr:two-component sensor histidine kinase [Conexibacter sp.]
ADHGDAFPDGLPPFAGTPCELVLAGDAPVRIADAVADGRYVELSERCGLSAYAGVPILAGEELIGVVCTAWAEPLSDGREDVIAALGRIARLAPRQLESHRRLLALEDAAARAADASASLRTIVSSLPDGLLLQDETGRTLVTNPAFCRMLELPAPEALAGTTREELRAALAASPAGQGDILETSLGAVEEGHAVLGRRVALPTGRTLEWDYLPVRLGEGGAERRLWHLRDVTARLVAERRLVTSERRFQALTSAAPPATGVFQLGADGRALFLDELCRELFGVTDENLAHVDWSAAIHPEDRPRVLEAWTDATERQAHYSISYRVLARGGERRLDVEAGPMHDGEGAFAGFVGTMSDVTAQVEATRARERSEQLARHEHQRLSDLVAGSPEPILSIGLDGRIVGMNPAALSTFGMTRPEAMGRALTELVSGADRAYLRDAMEDVVHGSGRPAPLEVLAVGPRPRMFLAELVLIPMRRLASDPADGVVLTAIFRDMSDHHRAQLEHLKRLETERTARQEAEAAQAELEARLHELHAVTRAKDTFVSMISHELRTPLTSIRTFSELLREDAGAEAEDDDGPAAVIVRNVERLERIVGDLLEVKGGIDPAVLHLERIDLRRLVRHEIAALRPAARAAGVELVASGGSPVMVCADPGRIGQVIGNLVDNALKFTPAGERVVVDTARREGGVVLEVSDGGVGIAAEELPRVFERFYQGSAGRALARGSGLGLSIAALVADAHGGQLDVSSRPGQGTTFTMTLPPAFEG